MSSVERVCLGSVSSPSGEILPDFTQCLTSQLFCRRNTQRSCPDECITVTGSTYEEQALQQSGTRNQMQDWSCYTHRLTNKTKDLSEPKQSHENKNKERERKQCRRTWLSHSENPVMSRGRTDGWTGGQVCDESEQIWDKGVRVWERLKEKEKALIMPKLRLDARCKVTADKSFIIYSPQAGGFFFSPEQVSAEGSWHKTSS